MQIFILALSLGSSLLGTGFGMKCKPLINYTMDTWSCFWYMDAPSLINSSEADTMCAGFGGSLSPFFSDDIYNGFVVKQLNTWIGSLPEYIWFGLNDVKEESIWRSWYGFSVENSIWWDKSQPDGNSSALDEDCTVITSSSKKLQDRDCSEEIASGAICFMYTAKNVGKRPHVPHQEAYYREEQTLHGFVFIQNKVFTRNIDDRDRCLSECLARKECISVVHISNDLDVCHGYSEIFDIGSLKIPNQSAKYFITYNS